MISLCPSGGNIWAKHKLLYTKVLYMSFHRFLLAVESLDLSQAEKVFFPKLSDG